MGGRGTGVGPRSRGDRVAGNDRRTSMNDDRFEMGPDLRRGRENLGDLAVLSHCLDILRDDTFERDGIAVEFGVGHGHSLRLIASVLPVIGFDSFMGLPEDWRPSHMKGAFGNAM